MSFVHLHTHSHYSLLDGACKIDQLVKRAVSYNMEALALTDHGNMFGTIEFYQTASKNGIKPIIGVEAYIAPRSRKEKKKTSKKDTSYHIILLAKNLKGYKNLLKLVSIGYLEGFYYKPRIDMEVLREYHDGLIALSSCIHGEIPRAIIQGDLEKAQKKALEYRAIFGEDFYLEIQNHGIPEEKTALEGMKYLSETLDIPLVATNDIHYLDKEHYKAHDVLLCIQTSKDLNDPNRLKYSTETLYFKSDEEMRELFPDIPSAVDYTAEVARKCNLELQFSEPLLPSFQIPEGSKSQTLKDYLREVAWEGLKKRYDTITPEIEKRFNYELDIINQMGYPGYFLIVKDFIDYARRKGIPVGPGRGSAAGSLISYACGITNIDPLRYNLFFERFLNPERVTLPDIDIDFCFERREEVIDYVRKKYGQKNVCQIITFGTMAARMAIRDVGRVLGISYGEVDRIAKLIPQGKSIEDAYSEIKEFREIFEKAEDERYAQLLEYAKVLEGLSRHASTHAAGVVIAPDELTNFTPLYVSNTGDITTQWDMGSIEKVGLLKIDFLGLRTLTVIDNTLKMLKKRGIEIDLDSLPLDDQKTYELFGNGETIGIFQFESEGMRGYLKQLKPRRIEDLIAMNALYRPGPMKMIPDFIARKFGKKKIEYLHPKLEPILKETYGIIVYQEQVMQIATELAGFSLGESDILRRAMGKKKPEVMAEKKQQFIQGAAQKGIDQSIAEQIFDLIGEFASYGFNKSHAAGYSVVAYQTAYLKAHYPAEFMAASLTSEMGNSDRIMILLEECKRLGLEILPPDINKSNADFTVDGNAIRFGLRAIKNVGKGAIHSIIKAREKHGAFRTIFDLARNVDLRAVNKKVLESLAKAGAMDSLEGHRAQLAASIDKVVSYAQNVQSEEQKGQVSLFDIPATGARKELSHYPDLVDQPKWSPFKQLKLEKELLGFYISGHPLTPYKDEITAFTTVKLNNLSALKDGNPVKVGGIITNAKIITDKKNRTMAFVSLEDFSGSAELIVFSSVLEKYRSLIQVDSMIFVEGNVSIQEEKDPKIRCDAVYPLAEIRQKMAKNICINFQLDDIKVKTLTEIKKLATKYKGNCGLLFHVTNGGRREYVIQSQKFRVDPSENFIRSVRELVGEENVWLEG